MANGESIITVIKFNGEIADAADDQMRSGNRSIDFHSFRPVIDEAFGFPNVIAVLMIVNSPGGSPVQGSLLANYIREKAVETSIPVYCIVEDMAASAGYDLAVAADEIYVDSNSAVGSIGVIFMSIGIAGLMQKLGVEPRVYVSGKHKAGMHPFFSSEELKEEEVIIRQQISYIHETFKGWIQKRRPKVKDDGEVFSGRVYIGKEAVDLGLADGVMSLAEVVEMKFPNRDDLRLIAVKRKLPPPSLRDLATSFL